MIGSAASLSLPAMIDFRLQGTKLSGTPAQLAAAFPGVNNQVNVSSTLIAGPASGFAPMTSVTVLNVAGLSGVTGTPADFVPLSALLDLSINGTAIAGPMSGLSPRTTMRRLYAYSMTALTGDINFCLNWPNIQVLGLTGCTAINGDIGPALTGKTAVTTLQLGSTNVSGNLAQLANLINLQSLFLNGTQMTSSQLTAGMLAFYNARAGFTKNMTINLATTKGLSGSYTAPPGVPNASNGNWFYNTGTGKYEPLTGLAAIYGLTNLINGETYKTHAITYDPSSPPVVSAIANQNADTETPVSLQIVSTSPQNNTLTYSATGLPPGLSVNSATGLITGTPTSAGVYSVTATADDGFGLSDSEAFTWTVNTVDAMTPAVTEWIGNTVEAVLPTIIDEMTPAVTEWIGATADVVNLPTTDDMEPAITEWAGFTRDSVSPPPVLVPRNPRPGYYVADPAIAGYYLTDESLPGYYLAGDSED
jgi:hypothetical protein